MGLFGKIARKIVGETARPAVSVSVSNKRVVEHPLLGPVVFHRRAGSKNIRLSASAARGLLLSYPWQVSFSQAYAFLEKQEDWALATLERVQKRAEAHPALTPKAIAALRKEAKEQLPQRLAALAKQYGFWYNKVFIKNNRSNWGSCSMQNNINLNLRLVALPEHLCDYVLLHELCHTRIKNHGPQFWELLNQLTAGQAKVCAKELRLVKLFAVN